MADLIPTMTGATTPSGEAGADGFDVGNEPWKAMDDDDLTSWLHTIFAELEMKNKLLNGDLLVDNFSELKNTAVSDNQYVFDGWRFLYALGSADFLVKEELVDLPAGAHRAIKLEANAPGTDQFGLFQVVEGKNCRDLIGDVASFACSMKGSRTANIRVAVLSWASTVNGTTADPISAWNGSGVDPTLAANWTYENTPVNIGLTTSWQDVFEALNVAIDTASTNNVAVMIWVDNTDFISGDFILFSKAQLEQGSVKSDFEFRLMELERLLADRYVRNVFSESGVAVSASAVQLVIQHPGMMKAPTPTTPNGILTITDMIAADFNQSSADISIAQSNTADGGRYQANNFSGMTSGRYSALIQTNGHIRLEALL